MRLFAVSFVVVLAAGALLWVVLAAFGRGPLAPGGAVGIPESCWSRAERAAEPLRKLNSDLPEQNVPANEYGTRPFKTEFQALFDDSFARWDSVLVSVKAECEGDLSDLPRRSDRALQIVLEEILREAYRDEPDLDYIGDLARLNGRHSDASESLPLPTKVDPVVLRYDSALFDILLAASLDRPGMPGLPYIVARASLALYRTGTESR